MRKKNNMKKQANLFIYVLSIMYGFYPIVSLIAHFLGYYFILADSLIFAMLLNILSIIGIVFALIDQEKKLLKVQFIFLLAMPFMVLLYWISSIFFSSPKVIIYSALFCFFTSLFFLFRYIKPSNVHFFGWVMYSICIFLSCNLAFLTAIFGSIGKDTVLYSLKSPDKIYESQLIDSNQGALGGYTLVQVFNTTKRIDLFFFKFWKKPYLAYIGEWGEFETTRMEWEAEHTLYINGKSRKIE